MEMTAQKRKGPVSGQKTSLLRILWGYPSPFWVFTMLCTKKKKCGKVHSLHSYVTDKSDQTWNLLFVVSFSFWKKKPIIIFYLSQYFWRIRLTLKSLLFPLFPWKHVSKTLTDMWWILNSSGFYTFESLDLRIAWESYSVTTSSSLELITPLEWDLISFLHLISSDFKNDMCSTKLKEAIMVWGTPPTAKSWDEF